MKKLLSLFLAAIIILCTFVGCVDNSTPTNDEESASDSSTSTDGGADGGVVNAPLFSIGSIFENMNTENPIKALGSTMYALEVADPTALMQLFGMDTENVDIKDMAFSEYFDAVSGKTVIVLKGKMWGEDVELRCFADSDKIIVGLPGLDDKNYGISVDSVMKDMEAESAQYLSLMSKTEEVAEMLEVYLNAFVDSLNTYVAKSAVLSDGNIVATYKLNGNIIANIAYDIYSRISSDQAVKDVLVELFGEDVLDEFDVSDKEDFINNVIRNNEKYNATFVITTAKDTGELISISGKIEDQDSNIGYTGDYTADITYVDGVLTIETKDNCDYVYDEGSYSQRQKDKIVVTLLDDGFKFAYDSNNVINGNSTQTKKLEIVYRSSEDATVFKFDSQGKSEEYMRENDSDVLDYRYEDKASFGFNYIPSEKKIETEIYNYNKNQYSANSDIYENESGCKVALTYGDDFINVVIKDSTSEEFDKISINVSQNDTKAILSVTVSYEDVGDMTFSAECDVVATEKSMRLTLKKITYNDAEIDVSGIGISVIFETETAPPMAPDTYESLDSKTDTEIEALLNGIIEKNIDLFNKIKDLPIFNIEGESGPDFDNGYRDEYIP